MSSGKATCSARESEAPWTAPASTASAEEEDDRTAGGSRFGSEKCRTAQGDGGVRGERFFCPFDSKPEANSRSTRERWRRMAVRAARESWAAMAS